MAIHRLKAFQPFLDVVLRANGSRLESVGLIDMGASMTAVHPKVLAELGATRVGTELIRRVDASAVLETTFLLSLSLGAASRPFEVEVVAAIPASPCDLLIGRDLLSRWILSCDGACDQLLITQRLGPKARLRLHSSVGLAPPTKNSRGS